MDSLREIIACVTREGVFGDVEFDSLIEDDGVKKGPQFMSTVMFVKIRVRNKKSGNVKDLPLVVKVQFDSEATRTAMNTDNMFANEVNMYQTVIPELGAEGCNAFPKCYYSRSEGGDDFKNDIVVLEDLNAQGFQQPKHKIFLDLPHLFLALKKIGEFHGLSYKFKRNNNTDVLKNKLIPTKFSKSWFGLTKPFLIFTTRKYGNALVEQGYDKAQFDKLEQKYENIEECFKFITQPEEPYAVICHGDFNRNNFLYKYNSDGHPTDVKFFDLQNSVYSDPVLDLCFFLYMNTTQATRQSHWTDLLNAYWDGILASAPQPGFTRFEFFANFEKKAFVGFVEPMFFIPVMMGDMKSDELGKYLEEPIEVQLDAIDKLGGIEAFEVVRDVMKHLVDNKAVQSMIEQ